MNKSPAAGIARAYPRDFRSATVMSTHRVHDPFTVNPIRRALVAVIGSLAVIWLPFRISEEVGATVMLSVGWLAMATFVISLPVLLWAIAETIIQALQHRLYPPVTELDLSDRVVHIMQRHGIRTVHAAERLDPAAWHLMANMTPQDARAIERAISLWRYRRWQEAGFPADGVD